MMDTAEAAHRLHKTRSHTDPPTSQPSKRSHLTLHPHLPSREHKSHHHHGHHSRRDDIKSAIQLHPPNPFETFRKEGSKASFQTPGSSIGSRRGSLKPVDENNAESYRPPKPRIVREEDVLRERFRAKNREEELRSALQTLNESSIETIRRLDNTYYNLLERVSVLRHNIGALSGLLSSTKELRQSFEQDADSWVSEVQEQISAFGDFDAQHQQVRELEQRVVRGKEEAQRLRERLAVAQSQIDNREQAEQEVQKTSNKRLMWFWGVFGSILAVLLGLLLLHVLQKPERMTRAPSQQPRASNLTELPLPPEVKEVFEHIRERPTKAAASPYSPIASKSEAAVIRHLEEL